MSGRTAGNKLRCIWWVTPYTVLGLISATLIAAAVVIGAKDITHLYLRQDAAVLMVALAVGGAALAVTFLARPSLSYASPLVGLVVWNLLSFAWSVVPAATLRASMWTVLYLAVFLVALAWPRIMRCIIALTLVALLFLGLDILLVTGSYYLKGVWFNKNVQGAHFLLLGPLLFSWVVPGKRISPYAGILLGIVLFSASLTRSAAAQILLAAGVVFLIVHALRGPKHAQFRKVGVFVLAMVVAGTTLMFMTIRPEAVQVFGLGIGTVDGVSLDKSNTTGSLEHRVEMIRYGLEAAADSALLGFGAGTAREVYPGIKKQPGVNVADIHNYYVELLMTVGLPGLVLFVILVFRALRSSLRTRDWPLFVALFLFSGYLAFDVPAYFPPLMMAYFALLGVATALHRASAQKPRVGASPMRILPAAMVGTALIISWAWWTAPCDEVSCITGRRLAAHDVVALGFNDLEADQRILVTEQAIEIHPKSYWPLMFHSEALEAAGDLSGAYRVYADLAEKFPYATLAIYGEWLEAAERHGDADQSATARRLAWERYGRVLGSESEE